MARTGRNGDAYLPGRREGDGLQVISIVNFKGGSGKTTTAIHLAQRYALRGYRVLAVDMDPQASLTTMFGYRPEIEFAESGTVYDALRYADPVPLSQVIRKTYFHKLIRRPRACCCRNTRPKRPMPCNTASTRRSPSASPSRWTRWRRITIW